MYRTQSNQIKGLTKTEYEALREMCRYAKNLYNVGLYSIRQYFFLEGKYWRYESNYQAVKDNENYALPQAGVGQQILKVVDRSFRSFFTLLKNAKQGDCARNWKIFVSDTGFAIGNKKNPTRPKPVFWIATPCR